MRVTCIQEDVVFADVSANIERALEHMRQRQGDDLVVFPECFLTGYVFPDADFARNVAIPVELNEAHEISSDHPELNRLVEACKELNQHLVVGFAARQGDDLHNIAALIEPSGRMRAYVKTHLPELGYDKMVRYGDDLPVFETAIGNIGIIICFDLRPPEAARVLALKGADLICLPTNWPQGAEFSADHIAPVRAAESRVFLACCDRCGSENGTTFIGLSGIYGVGGQTLAKAADGREVITADIEIEQAREKRIRTIPDVYEWTIFESRRPELYGSITDA